MQFGVFILAQQLRQIELWGERMIRAIRKEIGALDSVAA